MRPNPNQVHQVTQGPWAAILGFIVGLIIFVPVFLFTAFWPRKK